MRTSWYQCQTERFATANVRDDHDVDVLVVHFGFDRGCRSVTETTMFSPAFGRGTRERGRAIFCGVGGMPRVIWVTVRRGRQVGVVMGANLPVELVSRRAILATQGKRTSNVARAQVKLSAAERRVICRGRSVGAQIGGEHECADARQVGRNSLIPLFIFEISVEGPWGNVRRRCDLERRRRRVCCRGRGVKQQTGGEHRRFGALGAQTGSWNAAAIVESRPIMNSKRDRQTQTRRVGPVLRVVLCGHLVDGFAAGFTFASC